MQLTIVRHLVKEVVFDASSSYADGILKISKDALCAAALRGTAGEYRIDVQTAVPGESVRIVHVTDIIKPSCKEEASAFPGWTPGENRCGQGVTHQLENLCITQCFRYPGIQEGIVEMAPPGAAYSVFSGKINLVMTLSLLTKDLAKDAVAKDLIRIQTQAAEYAASVAMDAAGETLLLPCRREASAKLPRIGYAYFIQAQGPLRNVHIYAESCTTMSPRVLSVNEILDGALVSGNYIIACQKNPTYLHQENPILTCALARQGKSLNFCGVILSTESSGLEGKRDNARRIAELAREMALDGILVTQEGGGHADVDLMFTCEACEAAGIRVVLLANEIAGPEGALPPLVSFSSSVDAMVTTGNNDEIIRLEPVQRAIGGDSILNGTYGAADGFHTSLGILYTATNQLGVGKMKTVAI